MAEPVRALALRSAEAPAPARRRRSPAAIQPRDRLAVRRILQGERVQRQPEEGPAGAPPAPEPATQPSLGGPEMEHGITVDLLDLQRSSSRVFGWDLPSLRGVRDGLEALRRLGRRTPVPPGPGPFPPRPLELSDEDLRRIHCRIVPSMCRDAAPGPGGTTPPGGGAPPVPRLTLPPVRLQVPRLVFHGHRVLDHFVFDVEALPDRHRLALDRTAVDLLDHPAVVTDVIGHTDTRGDPGYNQTLSERRARAVESHLRGRHVAASQIWTVEGRGEREPREPNDQVSGLAAARNRRVELPMRRLVWPATAPPSPFTPLGPVGSRVTDPRARVLPAERAQYDRLVAFLVTARTGIRGLVASPPAALGFDVGDNENVRDLLDHLDRMIGELQAERWVVRFDQPAGSAAASYSVLADEIHLRPLANAEDVHVTAGSLVHEFLHARQDRAREGVARASRRPVEHGREDELRQEIESRRYEVYFTRLIAHLGHRVPFHDELSARVFVRQFERERTGQPADQAAARREIRQAIEGPYAAQLAANAPARTYPIELRGGRAFLRRMGGVENDLGPVPAGITTQGGLEAHLQGRVDALTDRAALFQGPGGVGLAVLLFPVFENGRKLGEFGLRP